MLFVTRTKSLLPIHSLFIQIKGKGKSIREIVLSYLRKKLKKVKWETPKEENVVLI